MEKENIPREKLTNYEIARILGARALQIAMDAPYLTNITKKTLEKINYNPMEIAKIEFELGVLPITIKQPMPQKKSVKIKKTPDEVKAKDKEIIAAEVEEEKDIEGAGEIMELANPDDEETEERLEEGRESSKELQ